MRKFAFLRQPLLQFCYFKSIREKISILFTNCEYAISPFFLSPFYHIFPPKWYLAIFLGKLKNIYPWKYVLQSPYIFLGGPGSYAPNNDVPEEKSTYYYMELQLENRLKKLGNFKMYLTGYE